MTIQFLMIGTTELLLIAGLALLLFGGKKLPEMMRGMGQGMRSFKEGMNGTTDKEDKKDKKETNEDETDVRPDELQSDNEQPKEPINTKENKVDNHKR